MLNILKWYSRFSQRFFQIRSGERRTRKGYLRKAARFCVRGYGISQTGIYARRYTQRLSCAYDGLGRQFQRICRKGKTRAEVDTGYKNGNDLQIYF